MCTSEESHEEACERSRQYNINNKANIQEYYNQYYIDNKEAIKVYQMARIAARVSERIHCEYCNCYNSRQHIPTHNKTKKHLANIKLVHLTD